MCGIGGVYCYASHDISPASFDHFIDSIQHRGPDGRGVYNDPTENLHLGHRRLNILDLSPIASQPMTYASGRYWITFNGEIFNFLELKKELEKKGFQFRTDSDTEVILAAYLAWGEQCQLKFNGMWAFAIWDAQEKSLFISRDRFGVKPLFYYDDGQFFAFASELKAFLSLDQIPFEFNIEAVACRLSHVADNDTSTLLKNVQQLPAGHSLFFSKQKPLYITPWWNTLDHLHDVPPRWEDQIEQFRDLFIDACRIRMRSDVPLGTSLSGGLDSSSVLCTVAMIKKNQALGHERLSNDWQKVFTATYPNTSQDEYLFAKDVIDHTGTTPYFSLMNPDELIKNFEQVLFDSEEIFDPPIGPWALYRHFRQNRVVISIDGHGADELLAGYHHHVENTLLSSVSSFIKTAPLWKNLSPGSSYSAMIKKAAVHQLKSHPFFYQKLKSLYHHLKGSSAGVTLPQKNQKWLFLDAVSSTLQPSYYSHPRFALLSPLDQMLYDDFHRNTLPMILRNFDRCSMAHGIEVRAPFMDWRLVCFCFSLSHRAKLGGGFTKRILREAMKGILPESTRTRKSKIGFANPTVEWFKSGLKPFVMDQLSARSFRESPIWNGPLIGQLTEASYQKGDFTAARRCWEFILAHRLMELFAEKRKVGQL